MRAHPMRFSVFARVPTTASLLVLGLLLLGSVTTVLASSPTGRLLEDGIILESRTSPVDPTGRFVRTTVVWTGLKYPLVRIEERRRRDLQTGAEQVLLSTEMVADHIIVGVREGKTAADLAAVAARLGGAIRKRLHAPNLYLVAVGTAGIDAVRDAVAAYRKEASVIVGAEPDYIGHAQDCTPNDPAWLNGDLWGMETIGAATAWCRSIGSRNIVVAVVDSGVDYTHPDLMDNIWINQEELKIVVARGVRQFPAGLDANSDGKVTPAELLAYLQGPNGGDFSGDGVIDLRDAVATGSPFLDVDGNNDPVDEDGNGYPNDVFGWDFHNNDNNPIDDMGHGTHVAGIIGAVGNNGASIDNQGVPGVSWQVLIVPVKVVDASGNMIGSDLAEAIYYAARLGPPTVSIINASLGQTRADLDAQDLEGQPHVFDTLRQAITYAGAAPRDILFVAAAGNGELGGRDVDKDGRYRQYPASYQLGNVVSVAASDPDQGSIGPLIDVSNYGAGSVHLGAPGADILSTLPTFSVTMNGYPLMLPQNYAEATGTSQASPHVAGACALLKAAIPTISAREMKGRLLATVAKGPNLQCRVATGGRLDAGALLATVDTYPNPERIRYHAAWDSDGNAVPDDEEAFPSSGILYVRQGASGTTGMSWDSAFDRLQDALMFAPMLGATQIWVSAGTYTPNPPEVYSPTSSWRRDASFHLVDGVTVYGGFPPTGTPTFAARDPAVYVTTLSGDLDENDEDEIFSDNSYHVVTAIDVGRSAVLDGFTITGGVADDTFQGAGVLCDGGSPTIRGCTIEGNQAPYDAGGGITCFRQALPAILGCRIAGNSAATGAGINVSYCQPGEDELGVRINNCTIVDNVSVYEGGGIACLNARDMEITNCLIARNSSDYRSAGAVDIMTCRADQGSVGVSITNCTIVDNEGSFLTGGIGCYDSNVAITSSIVWGNTTGGTTPQIAVEYSSTTVSYSDVEGGSTDNNNKNVDPLFVQESSGNYRLATGSPCIDWGETPFTPGPGETDLDGHARVLNCQVDMGAYEFLARASPATQVWPNRPRLGSPEIPTGCEDFAR